MDLEFSKDTVIYQKKVYDITLSHEQTQEAIVPDSLPDIFEILSTYANICLRGKDTDTGRVVVAGTAETSVLFSTENGERVRNLTANIPFTVSADAQEVTKNSAVITDITVLSADAKMINPRKVLIKIDLEVRLKCYNETQLCISSGVHGDSSVESLTETASAETVKNVTEKTFIVSDEYSISGSKVPVGSILACTSRLYAEDVKSIGAKLIVSGRVGTSAIYISNSGDGLECAEFSTMFSQIVELPEQADDHSSNVELMLTGAYYNVTNIGGINGISAEIHVVAQCETACSTEINYVADIFSTKQIIECETCSVDISERSDSSEFSEMLRGTIQLEAPADKILRTDYRASIVSLDRTDNGAEAVLKASAIILYAAQNGSIKSIRGSTEGRVMIPYLDPDACSVRCNTGDEIYVTPAGNALEICVPVILRTVKYKKRTIEYVSDALLSGTAVDNTARPSVIIYKTVEGDNMWSISKRFLSSRRSIIEANSLESYDDLKKGTLLLIPKSR